MTKKYELTTNKINFEGKILYQIKALKDFGEVKKGDLGGYIESEANLSQEGNCWISGNVKISGDAKFSQHDEVFEETEIEINDDAEYHYSKE